MNVIYKMDECNNQMDECLNKMNCVEAITKWMKVATNANKCNNVQRQQEKDVVD